MLAKFKIVEHLIETFFVVFQVLSIVYASLGALIFAVVSCSVTF